MDPGAPIPRTPVGGDLARRLSDRFPRLGRWLVLPVFDLLDAVTTDEVGVEAGSLTYGAFLSIPPLLLLVLTGVEVFLSSREDAAARVVAAAESVLPGLGDLLATGLRLSTTAVVGAGIVGVAALVWAASGFAARLRHALGAVFRTELVGLVVGRVAGVALGVPVLLLLVAYVAAGSWLLARDADGAVGVALDAVGVLGVLVVGVVVWTTVYRWMTPGAGPSFRDHLVGGTAFAVAFLVLERFGALYVERVVARSRALYGAIGALFGFLAFLYLGMWLFLLGAELTALRRARTEPTVTSEGAGAS